MSNDTALIACSDLRRLVEAAEALTTDGSELRNAPPERTNVETARGLPEAGLIDSAKLDLNDSMPSTLVAATAALGGYSATVVQFPAAGSFFGRA